MAGQRHGTAAALIVLSLVQAACGGGDTKTVTVTQATPAAPDKPGTGTFPAYMYTAIDASCAFIQDSRENAVIFARNVIGALNTQRATGSLEARIIEAAQRRCRQVKNPDYTPGTEIVSDLVAAGVAGK
jgi:hypothetical protein